MKLLVVASSLDLHQPLSATPAWWQLLKGLAENGVELIVAPYQGPPVESPWWTAAEPMPAPSATFGGMCDMHVFNALHAEVMAGGRRAGGLAR